MTNMAVGKMEGGRRMKSFLKVAAIAIVLLSPSLSHALADGPDRYRVCNVEAGDSLNLRAKPSMRGRVIGCIPYDAEGIENLGETRPPRVSEMQAPTWCKVRYDGVEGWAGCRYLGE